MISTQPEQRAGFNEYKHNFGFIRHKEEQVNNLLEDIWMVYQPIENKIKGDVCYGDCLSLRNVLTGRFLSLYSNY